MVPTVTESEISSLDDEGLNGRQVKNVVRIAYTLALSKGLPLNADHLRTALKSMRDFDRDFESAQAPKAKRQARQGSQDIWDDCEHQATRKRALSITNGVDLDSDDADDVADRNRGSQVKRSRVS